MRILILVHGYPPSANGGAELRAARTAGSLVSRGHDVRVLCVEPGHPADRQLSYQDEVLDGVMVRRLFLDHPSIKTPARWEYDDPRTARALEEYVAGWLPDIIHLFSGYRMTASVVRRVNELGIPIIVSLTDFWWLCHRITLLRTDGRRCDGPTPIDCARCRSDTQRRFKVINWMGRQRSDAFWKMSGELPALSSLLGVPHYDERLRSGVAALNQASALIAPSRYLADVYVRYGVDHAKIRTWRQGMDVDRCLLRTTTPELRVAYLGQVKYHKGVDLLLDAWGTLRGTAPRRLEIFGSDKGEARYGKRLRRQIQSLDGVTWNEPFPREALWSVLANTDAVVVPSRWVENSPNVILEAQAAGVVVVGTNLGGIAELVRHDVNGLLFEPDDPADLATQLQRLLDEPDLLPRLRNAPTPFQTHAVEMDQIEALYLSIAPEPLAPTAIAAMSD